MGIRQTIEQAKQTLRLERGCPYAKEVNLYTLPNRIAQNSNIPISEIRNMLSGIRMCEAQKDPEWNIEELQRRINREMPHTYHWRDLIHEQEDCLGCNRSQERCFRILKRLF